MPAKHRILSDLNIYPRQHDGDSIKDVILYGFQAREDSNEDSDYDILIILSDDDNFQEQKTIINLCIDQGPVYDIAFDVHVISLREAESLKLKPHVFIHTSRSELYARA